MKNFFSKDVIFSGVTIKSCVGFIDLVDSTTNIATMDNLESIRKYYSKFINSTSEVVKSYSGKVLKNIGDCILFYFQKHLISMMQILFKMLLNTILKF